jgi:hypothetical protein
VDYDGGCLLGIPHFFNLKYRIFSYIFLLVFVLYSSAFTQEANALLINKKNHLELVITSKKIEHTGSWMFFISDNLGKGSKKAIAGIEGVAHKIEGGRLSRYEDASKNLWRDLGKVQIVKNKFWQSIVIPKSIFFKEKGVEIWQGKIFWRLLLFPHHIKNGGVLLPKDKPGVIDLENSINTQITKPQSINFSYFYNYALESTGNIFKFGDGSLSGNNIFSNKNNVNIKNINLDHTLWWPDLNSITSGDLSLDNQRAVVIPEKVKVVVYPTLNSIRSDFKQHIQNARLNATRLSGRKAIFTVDKKDEIPKTADGIILPWNGDLRNEIQLLAHIRNEFNGPIWVILNSAFHKDKASIKVLSVSVLLKYKVSPMFSPEENVDDLTHREYVFFAWLKKHIDHSIISNKEHTKLFEIPVGIYLKEFLIKKKYASGLYMKAVEEYMDVNFNSLVKSLKR